MLTRRIIRSLLAVGALALAPALVQADALRCGSRLVHDGDHQLEVARRCGTPAHVAHRVVYRTVRHAHPLRHHYSRPLQRGPQLHLRIGPNGSRSLRVLPHHDVRRPGYARHGYRHHPHHLPRHVPRHLPRHVPGFHQRPRHHFRAETELTVPVEIEEWTYNFGPSRLMRRIFFENGRLVRIETLSYGY